MLLPISSTTSCRIKDIREEAPSALQIRPTSVDIFTISSGLLQDQVHKERTPELKSSGSRIIVTLMYEMKRRGLKYGLATLCIAGGMGQAVVIEMCD